MRIIMFYHSLLSDWNHGNAHFLRGVCSELIARGHDVRVYEPLDSWSLRNLRAGHGDQPIREFHRAYPRLQSVRYDLESSNIDEMLLGADVVIVHEWNDHALVRRIGEHRSRIGNYTLLFHDTHHRAITDPAAMEAYDLRHYDGVLAFGNVLRDIYLLRRWSRRAWTWHEAADTRLFRPSDNLRKDGDLVWIGNWGDDERTSELQEFLLEPIQSLKLRARLHGVRYPEHALAALKEVGAEYAGWLANYRTPQMFHRFGVTVHIPRGPYVQSLPGIPTIRVFEALACGIPLVCSPWNDAESLFEPGKDFLVAKDGREMTAHLYEVLNEPEYGREIAMHGRQTILSRHTCAHRVDELLKIVSEAKEQSRRPKRARPSHRTAAFQK